MLLDDAVTQQNLMREWANPTPPVEESFSAWSFAKSAVKGIPRGALNYFGSVRDFSNNIDQVHAGEVAAREKRLGLPASQPYIIPGGGEFRRKADTFSPDPETAHKADQFINEAFSGLTQAVGSVLTLGPAAGATAFGLAQGDDAYQRLIEKNPAIDKAAALKVAAVTGVAAGLGAVIPMGGATVAKTVGIVAAGGPGLFAAQEALSRNILQQAGATAEAAHHDPADPLGLALSLAIPGVFGGLHIRSLTKDNGARLAATVKQIESGGQRYGADGQLLTSPKGALGEMQVMPGTASDPGYGVKPAINNSPDELARVGRDYLSAMALKYGDNDKALAAYNAGPGAVDAAVKAHGADWLAHLPGETQKYVGKANKLLGDHGAEVMAKDPAVVDAARVRVSESVLHDSLPDVEGARAAVMRAADAVGEGDIAAAERGGQSVAQAIGATERQANLKAWLGDSKIVDDTGAPMRVYHVTDAENITSFDRSFLGQVTEWNSDAKEAANMARLGFWFSSRDISDKSAAAGVTYPVHLALNKPRQYRDFDSMWADAARYRDADAWRASLERKGHDGIVVKKDTEFNATSFVAFHPEQIKSAIGNSGRFDSSSASLTDPLPPARVEPSINRLPDPASVTAEPPKPATAQRKPYSVDLALGKQGEIVRTGEKGGTNPADMEAYRQAVAEGDQLSALQALDRIRAAEGQSLSDDDHAIVSIKSGTMSSPDVARLKTMVDEQPDMRVTLPGHDEPMRLADAIEAAKKEADLIRSNAELVRAAVACALENGAAIGAAA